VAVCLNGELYFCTGPDERKARNLAWNPHCILATGCNTLKEGLDVVDEGDAAKVRDDAELRRVADTYLSKYGGDWRFAVRDAPSTTIRGPCRARARPWCTRSLPRRLSASARASRSAKPAGVSSQRWSPHLPSRSRAHERKEIP